MMTPHQSHIDATLRALPSHGWTAGWVGRRDRALIILSQQAALPFQQVALLTAGDVTITEGTATIQTSGGTTTACLRTEDSLLCGPCALARWIHVLDLAITSANRLIAAVIARAAPLVPDSPHLCARSHPIAESTRSLALLPPIDQWGLLTSALPSPDPQCCADPAWGLAVDGFGRTSLTESNDPPAPGHRRGTGNRALFDFGLRTHQLERRTQHLLGPKTAAARWPTASTMWVNAARPSGPPSRHEDANGPSGGTRPVLCE